MVLRDVTPNIGLVFYTDARSQKIIQLQNEENVCLLFYNGSTMLQLKIHGKAKIMGDKKVLDTIWNTIPPQNQKDYTSTLPPGHRIEAPDNIRYSQDQHHFCMVEVEPTTIEYLKLGVAYHTKVLFTKKEKEWEGAFLIP